MKKVWKGFAAAVSAAAIAATGFIGATSAYADYGVPMTTTNTITINNAHKDDVFKGYRILNLESQKDTQYIYLVNDDYKNQTVAGIRAVEPTWKQDDAVADIEDKDIIDWITGTHKETVEEQEQDVANLNNVSIDTFARAFVKALPENATATFTTTAPQADGNVTVAEQRVGYYLISQGTIGTPDKYTATRYLIGTNGSTTDTALTVNLKAGTVEAIKKVQEDDTKNPAIGTGSFNGENLDSNYNDVADYEIGQKIPFEFRGTVPDNFDAITPFKYVFHDTMTEGLTFNNDVEVYVNSVLNNNKIVNPTGDGTTPFYQVLTSGIDDETFNVSFADLHQVTYGTNTKIAAGDTIIVRFTGKLNNNAVIGNTDTSNNINSMQLEFSNNPYDATDTEKTPPDKVVIFTYDLGIDKYATGDTSQKLDGAQFKLYNGNGNDKKAAVVTNGKFVKWVTETAEGVTPAVKGTTLTTSDGGKIKIEGLDSGTYYLEETKAPEGYNKIEGLIKVELKATTSNVQNWSGENANGMVTNIGTSTTVPGQAPVNGNTTVGIANSAGSALPETGGMGTTVLYVAGAAIVLIAGIGLAVALRRRQA